MPTNFAYATALTFGTATVNASGRTITIDANSAVDIPNMSTKHGWTVKAGSTVVKGVYKVIGRTINTVSVQSGKVIINLAPNNYILNGERVVITYSKPGDIDKAVRDGNSKEDCAVSITAKYPLVATNNSTLSTPTIDWDSSTVDTSGVAVKVYLDASVAIKDSSSRMSGFSKNHGWTVKRATVSNTTYSALKITAVDLASNCVTIHVYNDNANIILPGEKIKISYKMPSDVDKRIVSTNDVFMLDQAEKAIGRNNSTVPVPQVLDMTNSNNAKVATDGGSISIKTANAVDIPTVDENHGWAVKAGGVVKKVTSVSLTSNVVTVTLADDQKIGAGQTVQVSYTKPAKPYTNAVKGSSGLVADSVPYTTVTNNSAVYKPVADFTVPETKVAADGVTVTVKVYHAADMTSVTSNHGWAVKAGSVNKPIGSVAVSGEVVTIILDTSSDPGNKILDGQSVTVAYTKPTTGSNQIVSDPGEVDLDSFTAAAIPALQQQSACYEPTLPNWNDTTKNYVYQAKVYITFQGHTVNGTIDTAGWVVKDRTTNANLTISGITLTSNVLCITLSSPVTVGHSVAISYTYQTSGNYVKSSVADGSVPLRSFTNAVVNYDT